MNNHLLDGIVTFTQVVKSGSFTSAAEVSGHSTSYMSKQINKLEERIGIRLLHRTTRTLSLTPEGEEYYPLCLQLVEDAEQAENSITGRKGEPRGLLRVSCPISYGLASLSPIIGKFCNKYPKVQLDIDLNDRKVDLIADRYDVVIRAMVELEDSSLISRKITQSKAVLLASPSYLAKHGHPEHPQELSRHKVISYSNLKQPDLWVFQQQSGAPIQIRVNSHILCNNSTLSIDLAKAGQGIIRVPCFTLSDEMETGKLVDVLPNWTNDEIGVYMVYPSRKNMSSKVRSFIDFILAELGS